MNSRLLVNALAHGRATAYISAPSLSLRPLATSARACKRPEALVDEDIRNKYNRVLDGKDVGRTRGDTPHTPTRGTRTLPAFSLDDKVCVVTGAARGLGNLFARTFVESGCSHIAILDLSQEEASAAAEQLVKSFIDNGDVLPGEIHAMGYGLDVSNEESVKSAVNDIVQKWGRIDCLVAAAGIVENHPALSYPSDRMKMLYDINVHGVFYCAREVARHMIDRGNTGSIILISSMSADVINVPQAQTPYNASKAAVKHMATSLAVEWAKKGIRVNSLSPGYMHTPLMEEVLEQSAELQERWVKSTPIGRIGQPDDLKGAIVYLASDASKFTTGTELIVDGGYSVV